MHPELRPTATALLADPLLRAHRCFFAESAERCHESARNLCELSSGRSAGGQAELQSPTSNAPADCPASVAAAPAHTTKGRRAGGHMGAVLGGYLGADGGGASGTAATDELHRWEASLALRLAEYQMACMHATLLEEAAEARYSHDAVLAQAEADYEAERRVERRLQRDEMEAMERFAYESMREVLLRHEQLDAREAALVARTSAIVGATGAPTDAERAVAAAAGRLLYVPRRGRETTGEPGTSVDAEVSVPWASISILAQPARHTPSRLTPSPSESLPSKDGSVGLPSKDGSVDRENGVASPSTTHHAASTALHDATAAATHAAIHPALHAAGTSVPPIVGGIPGWAEAIRELAGRDSTEPRAHSCEMGAYEEPRASSDRGASSKLEELKPLELLRSLREAEEMLHARELQVHALKQMKKREEQIKLISRHVRSIATRAFEGWRRALLHTRAERALASKDEQIAQLSARLRRMAAAITDGDDKSAALAAAAEVLSLIMHDGTMGSPVELAEVGGVADERSRKAGSAAKASSSSYQHASPKPPLRRNSSGSHVANPLGEGLTLFERGGHGGHFGAAGSREGGLGTTSFGENGREVAREANGPAAAEQRSRSLGKQRSRESQLQADSEQGARSPGGLYERGLKQRQKREAAISRRRREREAAEIANCTFKPLTQTASDAPGREGTRERLRGDTSSPLPGGEGAKGHRGGGNNIRVEKGLEIEPPTHGVTGRRNGLNSPLAHTHIEAAEHSMHGSSSGSWGGQLDGDGADGLSTAEQQQYPSQPLPPSPSALIESNRMPLHTMDSTRGTAQSLIMSTIMSALPKALDSYRERRRTTSTSGAAAGVPAAAPPLAHSAYAAALRPSTPYLTDIAEAAARGSPFSSSPYSSTLGSTAYSTASAAGDLPRAREKVDAHVLPLGAAAYSSDVVSEDELV